MVCDYNTLINKKDFFISVRKISYHILYKKHFIVKTMKLSLLVCEYKYPCKYIRIIPNWPAVRKFYNRAISEISMPIPDIAYRVIIK